MIRLYCNECCSNCLITSALCTGCTLIVLLLYQGPAVKLIQHICVQDVQLASLSLLSSAGIFERCQAVTLTAGQNVGSTHLELLQPVHVIAACSIACCEPAVLLPGWLHGLECLLVSEDAPSCCYWIAEAPAG